MFSPICGMSHSRSFLQGKPDASLQSLDPQPPSGTHCSWNGPPPLCPRRLPSDREPSNPHLLPGNGTAPPSVPPWLFAPHTPGLISKSIPSPEVLPGCPVEQLPPPLPCRQLLSLLPPYLFPPCTSPQSVIILCLLFLLYRQPPSRTQAPGVCVCPGHHRTPSSTWSRRSMNMG